MYLKKILFLSLIIFFTSANASPYKLNTGQESWLIGTGLGISALGLYLDHGKSSIKESDLNSLNKASLNQLDENFAGNWNVNAAKNSDILLISSFAAPGIFLATKYADYQLIGIISFETFLINNSLTFLSKGSFNRYRPYTYQSEAPLDKKLDIDSTRSFFSGHASNITAGLVLTAKMYADYHPLAASRFVVWSAALAGSFYGSWLRVEAGYHFPSDVLVGMLWGGAVGYWIPEIHKQNSSKIVLPFIHENALGLSFSWRIE